MKLLYFTDTHIRGTSPKNRLDDFPDSLMKKFVEIKNIIDRENIDFVLHGGDLFDRPDVSLAVSSKFTRVLQDFNRTTYMISGNHDVYGHNPDTINRTVLGFLNTLGIITLIDRDKPVVLEKDGKRVLLTGQPYVYNIDEKKESYFQNTFPDENFDLRIHMVHGMLLDKPFIKGISYTLVDDILDTDADVLLAGHYHAGFKTINKDGKYFINPGSLVRISNTLNEIKRLPKVILIDLEEELNIREIYLKDILPGEDILDRTEIESAMFRSERISEFKQTIEASINFDKMDINDLIMEMSISDQVEEDVKIEALNRIANTQMNRKF